MTTLETEIAVDADADAVWDVLTAVESYDAWNPLIPTIEGSVEPDGQVRLRLDPPGSRSLTLRARINVVEPGGRLLWIGRFFVPNLYDMRHEFIIEPAETGVRFLQRGTFAGILVPFVFERDAMKQGFEEMNEALRGRVETTESERSA